LRESESKLNLALDQTHLAYWEMDAATKTFTFNDRFYALYGTTAKREGGYRMPTEVYAREFMLPDERHIVSEDVARLLSGDLDQFQREHRIRRRDGQIRHIMVHVKVVRDASGRIVGTRGANQDITDLRRTEQALLLKNHVFDASIAANSIADTDGIMTEVNHTFLRIWGYPGKDAAVGKSITDFFNDFTEAAGILQVLNVTGQWKGEFKAKRWNGSTFFAHGQATILRDAAGEAIGYQSTVIDISDRKLAEEEGKKHEFLNRQLVKSESLARMAGAIAHHFNNQLATVIISLDMTKRALSQRDYSLEMLTEATQAAHRAAEMSTLMLTYLGQTSDKKEPLDIAETCLSYLPILRASMPHTVVLETDMPSHGPTAVASANQIKQALNNLMTNAWESIGTGKGSIRLVVKTVAAADIATINRFPIDFQPRESTYACLEVADSGNGICDTDIEKIFDPFFSSKFAGRGLGLAVVLGIIKSHQGAITVASNLGRGSVFRVFLPMLPGINLTKPTRVLDQTVKAARRAGTVLVIEDEASLRKAVIFAIREIGFTVLEAADGVQGTEIFQQHKEEICLVICDLTMPRQGGWETISALRKIVPGIPIILASGYNESQVMAGSHSDFPQAFLSKPYEFEALRDAITRVLEKMDPSNVP
jgi:PAS domain S-box-containing protein